MKYIIIYKSCMEIPILNNNNLRNLYKSPSVTKIVKSIIRWTGHVARMERRTWVQDLSGNLTCQIVIWKIEQMQAIRLSRILSRQLARTGMKQYGQFQTLVLLVLDTSFLLHVRHALTAFPVKMDLIEKWRWKLLHKTDHEITLLCYTGPSADRPC
jgi:hypothetical protein